MLKDTLLVTGIHREELGFGDRVSELLDPARIDVLRIPCGVSQVPSGPDDRFYFDARHREIYLQLRQQVRGRYRLLIDLHSGLNESGNSADIYCHDERFLRCLRGQIAQLPKLQGVRLIKIIAQDEPAVPKDARSVTAWDARTWIPNAIWQGHRPLYVGVEVYLPTEGEGERADWDYARQVINRIACTHPDEEEVMP